jgi:phage FluMu gp28-like protein
MSAILPSLDMDSERVVSKRFMPHQVNWIEAEDAIHAQGKQVFALAEKSVRIGWTECDEFKNVRKRLRYPRRDYLFVSKDFQSALEYERGCYRYAEAFERTGDIVSHGEESWKVPRVDERGKPSRFMEEIRVGVIKFVNGSRIIAFSSNPQAMAVYGGDVGMDEFARHPQAEELWETAVGRMAAIITPPPKGSSV